MNNSYSNDIASKADQRVRELKQAVQENIDRMAQVENLDKNSKEEIKKEISVQIEKGMQAIKDEIKTENTTEIKKEFSEQIRRNSQATKTEC